MSRESARWIHFHRDGESPRSQFLRKLRRLFLDDFGNFILRKNRDMGLINRGRGIERFSHCRNMLGSSTATSAYNAGTDFSERKSILTKIFSIRGIHNASAHLFGPARVGLDPEFHGTVW